MCEGLRGNVLGPLLLAEAKEHEVLGGMRVQAASEQGLSDSGWEFTKLLTKILNILLNFGP